MHTYTIVDAINDRNVLPFRLDFVNTIKLPAHLADKQVSAIDTERALLAPERIGQVVAYIREHFDQKTKRSFAYTLAGKRLAGFNSLLATASIEPAKRYYAEFARQQVELPEAQRLKVGLIYSYAANEDDPDFLADEEFETDDLDASSRDFLEGAISDYNAMFGTSFDTSSDRFQNYYKDLSLRLRNRELDVAIVVNMFLTGFDATTLNTLWVDKGLRAHGLIQAYSRTNRILNSVKTYGNIVTFRDLEEQTNDALALFGNEEARGIVLLKPYADYYDEYVERVAELQELFPLSDVWQRGESVTKMFIALFGSILRLRNILTAFDEFAGNEILSERDYQDYQSIYLDIHAELRREADSEKESIIDDVVFEIELVKQVEVNVDYILMLVEQYREERGDDTDREVETLAKIRRAIDSSISLRNKRDLILAFVDRVSADSDVKEDWRRYVEARRDEELKHLIADEGLDPDATRALVERAFRNGAIPTTGAAVTEILPPTSRFLADDSYGIKKQTVLDRLAAFFDWYFALG